MKRVRDEGAWAGERERLSRRKFLKVSMTGAALAGAGGLTACMPSQTAKVAGTTPKALALYQDFPKQGRRCAECVHFLAPNACEIVAGEISPNGWCRFYRRRPG